MAVMLTFNITFQCCVLIPAELAHFFAYTLHAMCFHEFWEFGGLPRTYSYPLSRSAMTRQLPGRDRGGGSLGMLPVPD